jgi:uncharacterized protein (DUF1501 family)
MCAAGLATFALPSVSFARVPSRRRFVFVLLRGGFDGLAAVVPVGDPAYRSARGGLALDTSAVVPLDQFFGLGPGLAPLRKFWTRGELVALHAMAIPYRTRSHFDGQAILETGLDTPDGAADGWLNRLLQVMEGQRSGLAIAAGLPRSLSGRYAVETWSPATLGVLDDGYLERLHLLYRQDPELFNTFEAAMQLREVNPAMERAGRVRPAASSILTAAARLLRAPESANVAAVEFSGWDTHAGQGVAGGPLDRRLADLAAGLVAFRTAMGDAWRDTTVVLMTEFGRTVRPNGTGGTDHGTAGAGFLLGPTVNKSAVVSDWPGLDPRTLFEGRDVRPTLDTRAVLKGAIAGTFDLTLSQVNRIFPGSDQVRAAVELMR